MREVNKKVLGIALVLLFVAMSATPIMGTVMAGKGTDKLYYEVNIFHDDYVMMGMRTAPPDVMEPNVLFMELSADALDISIQIGSEFVYPDYYVGRIEAMMNVRQNLVLTQFWETYTFEGVDGTIEVSGKGRINNYGTPDAMSDMKIVGHGTGYFKGVKILAEGNNEEGDMMHKIHIGTIMGWPGLP